MNKLAQFKAVYLSGCLIHPSLVPALALLFEKVHLPNDLEFIRSFSKKYRFTNLDDVFDEESVKIEPLSDGAEGDPFYNLSPP